MLDCGTESLEKGLAARYKCAGRILNFEMIKSVNRL